MNCNERADNMSKRKLTDHFKLGDNKNVRKNVDSTVQNEPIIDMSQQKERNQFTLPMTFAFLKENLEKGNVLARPIGSDNSNGCIMMSSKWI